MHLFRRKESQRAIQPSRLLPLGTLGDVAYFNCCGTDGCLKSDSTYISGKSVHFEMGQRLGTLPRVANVNC